LKENKGEVKVNFHLDFLVQTHPTTGQELGSWSSGAHVGCVCHNTTLQAMYGIGDSTGHLKDITQL
jgi:hypothetical protein